MTPGTIDVRRLSARIRRLRRLARQHQQEAKYETTRHRAAGRIAAYEAVLTLLGEPIRKARARA